VAVTFHSSSQELQSSCEPELTLIQPFFTAPETSTSSGAAETITTPSDPVRSAKGGQCIASYGKFIRQRHDSSMGFALTQKSPMLECASNTMRGGLPCDIVVGTDAPTTSKEHSIIQVSRKAMPKRCAWEIHPSLVRILSDEAIYAQYLCTSTEAAAPTISGFQASKDVFDDDKNSNGGVGDSRGNGSSAPYGLVDWDGSWGPAPCDWESGRTFDNTFVPTFIKDWVKNSPAGPSVTVNQDTPEFILGNHPINNGIFAAPIIQPECLPGKI
jgi:hypothetical protein